MQILEPLPVLLPVFYHVTVVNKYKNPQNLKITNWVCWFGRYACLNFDSVFPNMVI